MLYRTVIIEDDSVITHLNRRYVEMDNRFCVVQTFSAVDGIAALAEGFQGQLKPLISKGFN